jgi:hypothetical protein
VGRAALGIVAVGLLAGCRTVSTTRVKPVEMRPSLEAASADLVERFNRQAAAVRSLNARVELNPVAGSAYSGVIQDYRDVRGFILAQRPASIRMIGQAPVVASTIFDMVSDGETFRVSIPPRHKFLVGPARFERPAAKPIENLRPHHLVDALFWAELPPVQQLLWEEFEADAASPTQAGARFYILTELRGADRREMARKVWFDRADLSIARVQVYGPAGKIETDARYSEWQSAAATEAGPSGSPTAPPQNDPPTAGDLRYPRKVIVVRPRDDYRLEIRITRLTLNEAIAADRFHLEQPPGSELVRIGDEGKKAPTP